MPNVNDKIMIELILNAKKAIQEAQKAVNAISGIKDKEYQADKENAKKQEELAQKTGKAREAITRKGSAIINQEMALLTRRFFSLYAVIRAFSMFNQFASMGADIRRLAETTGLAEGRFEKLGNAAQKVGGSYQSTASTLKNLRSALQRMKFGEGGILQEAAMKYQLQLGEGNQLYDTENLMRSIARTMGALNKAGDKNAMFDLQDILGIDDATFKLIKNGEQEYLRRVAEAEANSAKAKAESVKYVEAVNSLKVAWDKFGIEFGQNFAPLMTKLLNIWTQDLKDINLLIADLKSFFGENISEPAEAAQKAMTEAGDYVPDMAPAAVADTETYKLIFKGIREFLLPFGKAIASTPMIIPAGAAGMGAMSTINIYNQQSFNGSINPEQAGSAAERGVRSGLSAARNLSIEK